VIPRSPCIPGLRYPYKKRPGRKELNHRVGKKVLEEILVTTLISGVLLAFSPWTGALSSIMEGVTEAMSK
jgi:hypothetical protein